MSGSTSITDASQIAHLQPQTNATDALAQSQSFRNDYSNYLANPTSDPVQDSTIRQIYQMKISGADAIATKVSSSDPATAASTADALSAQSTQNAQNVINSPNSTNTDTGFVTNNAITNQQTSQAAAANLDAQPPVSQSNIDSSGWTDTAPSSSNPITDSSPDLGSTADSSGWSDSTDNNFNDSSDPVLDSPDSLGAFDGSIVGYGGSSDSRIRITPKNPSFLFESEILAPLAATNGLMFPYTPNISWSVAPQYSTQQTTHANQDYRAFVNVPAMQIVFSCPFTAQNNDEALYMIGTLHFLRSVTKMHFGTDDNGALGLPPPVMKINGYGPYVFNNLPVIITAFNMEMNNNIDYVSVTADGTLNKIPVMTNISVTCVVQTTPQFQRTFNWDQFANGTLMKSGGWF
jgi:hypothetical protein